MLVGWGSEVGRLLCKSKGLRPRNTAIYLRLPHEAVAKSPESCLASALGHAGLSFTAHVRLSRTRAEGGFGGWHRELLPLAVRSKSLKILKDLSLSYHFMIISYQFFSMSLGAGAR